MPPLPSLTNIFSSARNILDHFCLLVFVPFSPIIIIVFILGSLLHPSLVLNSPVVKDDLEILNLLLPLPESWRYRCVLELELGFICTWQSFTNWAISPPTSSGIFYLVFFCKKELILSCIYLVICLYQHELMVFILWIIIPTILLIILMMELFYSLFSL